MELVHKYRCLIRPVKAIYCVMIYVDKSTKISKKHFHPDPREIVDLDGILTSHFHLNIIFKHQSYVDQITELRICP